MNFINHLLNDMSFTWFIWVLTLGLTILFFAYTFSKEGRDEHGRAIIGTACFYGIIGIIVLMNILTFYMYDVIENVAVFANSIRLVYDGFMLITVISIAVLRKIR